MLRAQIPRSNVGQVVHVSPTPRVTLQEVDITRRTPEAACWLWLGAAATTLRTATLTLVYSAVEYRCAPTWCQSARTHLIYLIINDAWRIMTGCLSPTPTDNLPTLAGIQAVVLRRKETTLSLARRAMEPRHLLHSALTSPITGDARQLRSRQPFIRAEQKFISSSDDDNTSSSLWADHRWNAEWLDNTTRLCTFIPDTGTHPSGMALPRTGWVRLNRLRTGVGRFRSCLRKWIMDPSAACGWAAEESIVSHVALQCPIHRPLHRLHGLTVPNDETIEWLLNNCPEI